MSPSPTSRSEDLQRLAADGYVTEIREGHLLVRDVPYVDSQGRVARGVLVSTLTLAGNVTTRPDTHVVYFIGDAPHEHAGARMDRVINGSSDVELAPGIVVNHSFSSKPTGGYADYYDKITTYVSLVGAHAQQLDPEATARTHRVLGDSDDESPFTYLDTASPRAQITSASAKFRGSKIAIAGLGGTGAYILDKVAKTPVEKIHLYDGDRFFQHNAFRSPGAASLDDLVDAPFKVDYFAEQYSRMHRGVVAHRTFLDADNAQELGEYDFVFVAIDKSAAKAPVLAALIDGDVAFIDVGMGIYEVDGALAGVLRVTTSTPANRSQAGKVNLTDGEVDDEYACPVSRI